VLTEVRPQGYAGMAVLVLASMAAGWLLGGPGRDTRKALTLTTTLRNVGVGLVLATVAFPPPQAVAAAAAVVAYGIVEILAALLLALWWGRRIDNRGF
jgi:BASS family bile acid:Na+ symporter